MNSTKNFNSDVDVKMKCTCCGKGGISIATLIVLEDVRRHFDKPVTITSGARCESYNKSVGGTKRSEHLVTESEPLADAVDIVVEDVSPTQVYLYLKNTAYASLLGLGKYKEFTHVDTRGYAARW